ncbi:MAG: bifunctional 4-hydroxy-2-oxoglutarate aldolase/2-dehydro-3-deoxy-phosphogluconate aldolase, partial [Saprospiraceae bacterium]|nr:bifunctional 4-hydroxy-2-oxoglutarate aldolase/2-dehydro-3-deoxy-phosphogluconate aldolase [Saprospiraceae bacterium]
MAKYTRLQVASAMLQTGLVPLFYHPDMEVGKQILRACHQGGATVVEFTNRGDFAHEVFGELNKYVLEELPGLMLGAGSVPDVATAGLFIQLGANFIVSPSLRQDIAAVCNRRKILWSPGCATLTEIGTAEELGCEIVKLFPGGTNGPAFVKAIRGPQPWTQIMPTGGVAPTRENLTGWFEAGVACVGMGSKLISKEIIQAQDWAKLAHKVT